jgi:shikimate dehydrogenase
MVGDPTPRLFALLGDPVAGNPTQEIVEDAFRHMGLDWRYVSVRVAADDLPAAMGGIRAMGFAGANVTVPHKVAVVPLVDDLSPAAASIGAVNCIVRDGDRLTGENTDGAGLVAAVARVAEVRGADVLLFGAGGAARAIAVELALAGARSLRIVNRDPARREGLVRALQPLGVRVAAEDWPTGLATLTGERLVINATTLGMRPDGGPASVPVDWARAGSGVIAADVVIRPSTVFLREAAEAGATPVTGLEMLVEQAVRSLQLWTGRTPDRAALRAVLERELGVPGGNVR